MMNTILKSSREPNRFFVFYNLINLIFITLMMSGCSSLSNYDNNNNLKKTLTKSQEKNFIQQALPAQKFTLTTFSRITDPTKPLIIYLEGDGHSRESRYQLSKNPTPHQPLGLELALSDPRLDANILYIARPGQYTPRSLDACDAKYWSTHRFSQEVIDSTNDIINQFKTKIKNKKLQLIGFSGGGGLAVLVAAHRDDVESIMTVAGDLDHIAMSAYHKTMPLTGSLNPRDFSEKINRIPQVHLVGKNDVIVPQHIAQGFLKASGQHRTLIQLIDATHHTGWREQWPGLVLNTIK